VVGDDRPWLTSLVGGLPADFDYGVIRSADDARSLILTPPATIVGWRRATSMTIAGLLGAMLRIAESWQRGTTTNAIQSTPSDREINSLLR
jgi:hypothetical protein